jgi:hypothetical protein
MEIAQNVNSGSPAGNIQPRRQKPAIQQPIRRSSSTRCSCGVCVTCHDNARWERVFNEKFADPEYYQPRAFKRGSSLSF